MWDLINCVIGKASDKSSVISHIIVNQVEILNEKAIANEFGKYFSYVGKEFATRVGDPKNKIAYYSDKILRNPDSIYFYPTSETEIRQLIENLPNKSSSGHNILLKKICPIITQPLVLIFNLSLLHGVFPSRMKLSEITPLHKGSESYYTNNYRPISLLLTISKLLEKIVYKRTYKFLNETDQFYNSQYGLGAHTLAKMLFAS